MKAALLASCFVFASGSAFADWQGTVWNMSFEEADKSFRIPHHMRTPDDRRLWFTYTVNNLEFEWGALEFSADGKLFAIGMRLKEPTDCDQLMEVLRRIYGKPAKEEMHERRPGALDNWMIWYDEKNHNEVKANYISYGGPPFLEPDCFLTYRPVVVPAPGSL